MRSTRFHCPSDEKQERIINGVILIPCPLATIPDAPGWDGERPRAIALGNAWLFGGGISGP